MVWPVMKLLSSEARNTTTPTRSSGRPRRFSDCTWNSRSARASCSGKTSSCLGADRAGGDGVDGDAVRAQLARQGAGEADHPGLGGDVVQQVGMAEPESDRGDADDAAM